MKFTTTFNPEERKELIRQARQVNLPVNKYLVFKLRLNKKQHANTQDKASPA
jgi:hypothetical protein